MMESAIKDITNITSRTEHHYVLKTKEGRSDIDLAIYCEEQKLMMVLEAKWIDKHYRKNDIERFSNIYATTNEIYKKQLSNHQTYLEVENGIEVLFDSDIDVENIEYFAVDKRSQLHTEEMHLLSVYVLIKLINMYTKDGDLNLSGLVQEIRSLRTTANYYPAFRVSLDNNA